LKPLLRNYLFASFQIIELSIRGKITFKFTYTDVKGLSLGRLVDLFAKYNGNEELLGLLRELPKKRNDIVHEAYLLTEAGRADDFFLSTMLEKVKNKYQKKQRLL